jgi:hypothetical protein
MGGGGEMADLMLSSSGLVGIAVPPSSGCKGRSLLSSSDLLESCWFSYEGTMSPGCVCSFACAVSREFDVADDRRLLRHTTKRRPASRATPTGIATPMPALAPVDRPLLCGSAAAELMVEGVAVAVREKVLVLGLG